MHSGARFTLAAREVGVAVIARGEIRPPDVDRLAAICASLPPEAAMLRVILTGGTTVHPSALDRLVLLTARWRAAQGGTASVESELESAAGEHRPTPRRRPAFKRRTAPWPRYR